MAPQAPVSNRPERRPEFAAGGIFSRSFAVWFAQLPAFLVLTVAIFSPLVLYLWLGAPSLAHDNTGFGVVVQNVVLAVGEAVLASALAAAFSYGVFRRLQKQPAGMGECVTRGLASLPGVFGVVFVRGLGIGLLALPAAFVEAAGLAYVALHIPSYWLATVWSAAVPAAVIERLGVAEALERSTKLTSGYRGTIFGAWIMIGVVFMVVVMVLTVIGVQGLRDATEETQTWALLAGLLVTMLLISSVQAVTQAVIYHGLRMRKEGVTADDLIRAFE